MKTIQFPARLAVLASLLCLTVGSVFANEVTAVWERIYRQSVSDDQRYAVMLKIMELKNKDFAPLISESLEKLFTSKIESADITKTRTKIALAKLLIQELGNLRSADDAQLVGNVYLDVKDPFLKSDAAVALGKMRATDYAEKLSLDLTAINISPDQANPGPKEILAYGLVQSLELMHSSIGFKPAFFASIGWYSNVRQVKDIARSAVKTMIEDPSPQLREIIVTDTDYSHKISALDATTDTNAPAASKNDIARIALGQGLNAHENDPQKKRQLAELRGKSIKILVANQDKAPETVSLYRRILEEKFSVDESLIAFVGLGRNASKDAVTLLIEKMTEYNERQKAKKNTSDDDRKIIMQIIQSLKDTKSPEAKNVLITATFSDHDGTVTRTAQAAADSLP